MCKQELNQVKHAKISMLCVHCIVFNRTLYWTPGKLVHFILKVMKWANLLGLHCLWSHMIRRWSWVLFLAYNEVVLLGSLAIMHWKCLIGGCRAKCYTPFSLRNDKKSGSIRIPWKMHCFASVVLCCNKTRSLEKQVADRPLEVAGSHFLWPTGHQSNFVQKSSCFRVEIV